MSSAKQIAWLRAAALLFGALAWPINSLVWPTGGSIWYGDIPGAVLSSVLALFLFVTFRPSPRIRVALIFSLLALTGAFIRQVYQRNQIQAYCEQLQMTDCGELLFGLPKLGWPVIFSPFVGVIFPRTPTASGEVTRKITAFTKERLKTFPILKTAGLIAILGTLTWQRNIAGLYNDLPGAFTFPPGCILIIHCSLPHSSLVSRRHIVHRGLGGRFRTLHL